MSQPNRCPECGAELPSGALGGLCPKCLLAAGLESRAEPAHAGGGSEAPTTPHSGTFVPPDAASLAAHFPQLEILELLGHGGMGAVYKARQPKLDRLVALKIIRPESAHDPAFAERFNREARMLARLSHPRIVAVYDFGEVSVSEGASGGPPRTLYFFLMEYVEGTNLRQLLQDGELLPQQALAIVPQICEALQYAHDEGVVHRDIKPENILLDKRGRVKIADFGLAKLAAGSPQEFTLTGTHQVMGTPRYMAPEQMEGSHAVDHRADIYSLGVVFYEMLTGEVPMGHFEPPSQKVEVDVRLDSVILRTLARQPERRYQHASDVKTDVEAISYVGKAEPPSTAASSQIADAVNHQLLNGHAPHLPVRLFALVLAIIGAVASFLPWAEIVPNGVDIYRVAGWKWWQGLLGCFSFVAVLVTLLATLSARGILLWRSIVFVLSGLLVMVATSSYILEFKLGTLPMMPFIEAAGLKTHFLSVSDGREGRFLKTIGESDDPSKIGAGAFIALFAGIAMTLLGAGEIAVRLQRIRAGIGGQHTSEVKTDVEAIAQSVESTANPNSASVDNAKPNESAEIQASRLVQKPAWGLIITGLISWVTIPLAFAIPFIDDMEAMNAAQRVIFQISFGVVPLVLGTIMALAGFCMKRLEGYQLAMCAAVLPIVVLLLKLIGLSFGTLAIGPADLVGAPIGLWVLVVLTRSDVQAAFHRSTSEQDLAPRTVRGTLGQAWDAWWAERDRWFTRTVLAMLILVHIVCLAMFLTLRGGGGYDSGRASAWHYVGWPTPWFVYERGVEPNVAFRRTINLLSSSIVIAGVGMLAWYAFWRVQLVRDARNARFWQTLGSPTSVLIIWILAGAAFAWLGVRDANRLYESRSAQMAPIDSQQAAESPGLKQRAEPSDGAILPSEQDWTMTPDGPMLTDGFARMLELDSAQTDEFNRILQGTYSEYLTTEQQYLEQQKVDDRHVTITIKPHPEAVAKLEDRLWTQLDAVLDSEQQRIARLNLHLDPRATPLPDLVELGPVFKQGPEGVPEIVDPVIKADRAQPDIMRPGLGFFGWGKDGVEIEIWHDGARYRWKVRTRRPEWDPNEFYGAAPKLPEWLRRFWNEPHGQATSPRSDE